MSRSPCPDGTSISRPPLQRERGWSPGKRSTESDTRSPSWLNVIGWFIKIDNYQGSWLDWLQTGSWFWSFATAPVFYYILMTLFGRRYLEEQTGERMTREARAPARA